MKTKKMISFLLENKTNAPSSVYLSLDNQTHKMITENEWNKDFNFKIFGKEAISSDYENINVNDDFILGELTEEQTSFKTTLMRILYVPTTESKKEEFLNIAIYNLKKDVKSINSRYLTGRNISVLQQQQTIVDIVNSNNLENKDELLFDFKENPTLNFYVPAKMKVEVVLFGYINSETEVLEKEEVLETCN